MPLGPWDSYTRPPILKKFIRLVSSNIYSNVLSPKEKPKWCWQFVCHDNHIMNWEAREIVEQLSDKFKRWIQESIHIRTNTLTMNRDEGAYQLSPTWTQVISTPNQGGRVGLTEYWFFMSQLTPLEAHLGLLTVVTVLVLIKIAVSHWGML